MVFNSSPPPSWNGCLFPLHFLFVSMLPSMYLRFLMFFPRQSWWQLVIHSACILIVYSAYDSHKQVTITSFIMLVSVLNLSVGPCAIQFLCLDSFKGGFNFYFLKIFVVPHPFPFWCSPSRHHVLILGHLPLPHQIFSWFLSFFLSFFFSRTTLCFIYFLLSQFSSVQSFSHHRLFTTP